MEKTVTISLKLAQDLLGLAVLAADSRKQNRTINSLKEAIRAASVPAPAPAPLFQDSQS